jgi:hypothetical protein
LDKWGIFTTLVGSKKIRAMYLQLAESPTLAARRKYTTVRQYSRRANTVPRHRRALNEGTPEPLNPYLFIPKHISGAPRDLYVREDYFDDLTDAEWKDMAWRLAPFQKSITQGLSEVELLSGRAERRKKREEKKKAKQERKAEKQKLKMEKKQAKNEIKKARAEAIKTGKGGEVGNKILSTIGGIAGAVLGIPNPAAGPDAAAGATPPDDLPEDKPWYKNPFVIGGGVLLLGTGIYLATRKRN